MCFKSYNFKEVSVNLGNGSAFDGEWMFMLFDGTAVPIWALDIDDEEDEEVARSFGLTELDIQHRKYK